MGIVKSKIAVTAVSAGLMFAAGMSANASWSFGNLAKGWSRPAATADTSALRSLPVTTQARVKASNFNWEKGLTGEHRYIVRLSDEPLASYRGGIEGLAPTNPDTLRLASRSPGAASAGGNVKLNTKSAASTAYLAYLDSRHARFEQTLQRVAGNAEVVYRYQFAFNGMTVTMTQDQAARVARLPGVRSVQRDFLRNINTAHSVALIGAPAVWDGSATGGLEARGEGMVVGVIDTGINTDHPSFDVTSPGDGYVHTNPLGAGNFLRDCAPFDPTTNPNGGRSALCNDKLIGTMALPLSAESVGQEDAQDWNGHGSHTASTAAGNLVLDVPFVDFEGNPTGISFQKIVGVAPRAAVSAYMACGNNGCPGSDLIAAIDAATEDEVDVINYSIGGGPIDPWNDGDSLAFLGSRDAGIFVATSASNDGPGPGTVGSPAVSPWLTSVAASTHQREWSEKHVADLTGGDTAAPADLPGRSATGAYGPAGIVYAGDYGDPLCALNAFPAGTFNGEIVLCDRGAFALVDKAASVSAGGAGGIVIATTPISAQSLFDIPYNIPGIQIGEVHGNQLRDWLASGSGHTGSITGASPQVNMDAADIVAAFSGRGPNASVPDIVTPGVSAPGVNVYAAVDSPREYGQLSGTSMSSPHVAGAGALVRQVHPDWSAAEVHSALATTGVREMSAEEIFPDPANPTMFGGGRIQVDAAVNAGLVLHETTANFQAANPGLGGDPTTLNLPSFGNSQCLEICTWERTVRATASGTWTVTTESETGMGIEVSPSSFTLSEGQTQVITVSADVQRLPYDEWVFGWVHLTPDGAVLAPQAMPVAVSPTAGILPERLVLEARRDAASQLVGGFQTGELASLQIDAFGLAAPDQRIVSIEGDNGGQFTPYVDEGVAVEFYDVAPGSVLFSARTSDSTSPDVDLFVGRDNNGDGQITADEELCQSGNPDDNELCELTGDVVAQGGSFWVAVINFESSGAAVDDTLLTVAIAEPSTGGFSATPPNDVQPGEEWEIRVFWDQEMEVGDMLMGAVEVSAGGESLAIIPVELARLEDDVRVSASADTVEVGDIVDMTVELEANLTPEDLFYVIDAEVPEGFEYVAGSARTSIGDVYVINGMLIWIADHPTLSTVPRNYLTSVNGPNVDPADPHYNPACDTGFGGYVNFEDFGIAPDPNISGDTVSFLTLEGQNLPFFNKPKTGFTITDDGFGVFASGLGPTPWQNTNIPNAAEPNDMVALAWKDLEIVYDAAANSGVTIQAPGPNLSVIEFDDMQPWPAGSTGDRIDFEVIFNGAINDAPNKFEIVLAYDNIVGDWSDATVGLENQAGSLGTQYDGELSDGLMICYDYQGPDLSDQTLTYQIRAVGGNASSEVEHRVFNINDNPGSREEVTSVTFTLAADSDADGVSDNVDNCINAANADQTDTDNDGYGNACDADFDQTGHVDFRDVHMMRGMYDSAAPLGDLNGDGWVDMADVAAMRPMMFGPPGPSAIAN